MLFIYSHQKTKPNQNMTNFCSSSVKGLITLKNTKSYKLKFARRFFRSLMKIKRASQSQTTHNHDMNVSSSSSSDVDQILKRSQRIKLAAYSSMAHAIGPRKVWTRALLFKLHNRKRRSFFIAPKRSSLAALKKTKTKTKLKRNTKKVKNIYSASKAENIVVFGEKDYKVVNEKSEKLREVVPGGKEMDICSLFEETAHFIQCLTLQVQVMQNFVDHLSK